MCGIAGILNTRYRSDELRPIVMRMIETLSHRGPDHSGTWADNAVALGHARLKVIDLSDAANQPFQFEHCVITYNGEVYNYRELRIELESSGFQFKTRSDTEVVLAAYLRWGVDCVKRFVGMWAFAIWDEINRQLFCSRDRFGIKPFYYSTCSTGFYFASECKALKAISVFSPEINLNQVNRGLLLGWSSYCGESYYEEIKCLPPAHNLVIKDNTMRVEKYWDLQSDRKPADDLSWEEKQQKFYTLFRNSTEIHSRCDVPVGVCLSGGLDSSSIASMHSHLFPKSILKTFTIFYSGKGNVDETPFAKEVSGKFSDTIEPHYFSPRDEDIAEEFHKASSYSEIPIPASSFLSQYFVMSLAAKNGVKVVMDGQGSDEYLAGYMHSFSRWLGNFLSKRKITCALKLFNLHRKLHSLTWQESLGVMLKSLFMSVNGEMAVLHHEYKKIFPILSTGQSKIIPIELLESSSCKIENFLYHLLFTTSLPTLLHYEDRNSMAFSIESRVPFLDHRLVEFIYALPPGDKISEKGETKYILRQSLKDVLPEKIARRQDKKAFVTPGETQWLRTSLRHLLELDYSQLYWLNPALLKRIIDDYKKGDNRNAKFVWRLSNLNYWLKNVA